MPKDIKIIFHIAESIKAFGKLDRFGQILIALLFLALMTLLFFEHFGQLIIILPISILLMGLLTLAFDPNSKNPDDADENSQEHEKKTPKDKKF